MKLKSIVTTTLLAGVVLSLTSCDLVSEKKVNDSDLVTSEMYINGRMNEIQKIDSLSANRDIEIAMKYDYKASVYGISAEEKATEYTYIDADKKILNHIKNGYLNGKKYKSELSAYCLNDDLYLYTYESYDGNEQSNTKTQGSASLFNTFVEQILSLEILTINPLLFNFTSSLVSKYYITNDNMYTVKVSDYVMQDIFDGDVWTCYSRYPQGETQFKLEFKELDLERLSD